MSNSRKASLNLLITISTLIVAQTSLADPINWRNNLDAAKVEASRTGKLVLLHFYTSSCGPCKKLDREVFSQPQIAAAMEKDYVPVKLNADQSPALANAYQITRVPFEVVLNSQGNILQKLNCPLEPGTYGSQLVNVAQHYRGPSGVRTASAQTPVNSAYAGLKINPPARPSRPAPQAPSGPALTQNPYVTATQPAPATQAPAPSVKQPAAVPVTPTPSTPPARYQNRYAQVAPKTPPMTQAPTSSASHTPAIDVPVAVADEQKSSSNNEVAAEIAKQMATATAAAQVAKVPVASVPEWPPQLPAGTPPLAFEGYCPVSLREQQKWVRGDKAFGAIHRGQTFLFASDAERAKFLASTQASDSYSPVFSGNDPVKLLDEKQTVAGSRKFGFQHRNAFYLFSSKETMEQFARQPDRYSQRVMQAMTSMDASVGGTIRR